MAKRNYPSKRKPAATWEYPICKKIMNIRGKSGHEKSSFKHQLFILLSKEKSNDLLSKRKTYLQCE